MHIYIDIDLCATLTKTRETSYEFQSVHNFDTLIARNMGNRYMNPGNVCMYILPIHPMKWDFRTLLHFNFNIHLTRNMSFIGTLYQINICTYYIYIDIYTILTLHISILVFRALYITSYYTHINIHMIIYVIRSILHLNHTFNKMTQLNFKMSLRIKMAPNRLKIGTFHQI